MFKYSYCYIFCVFFLIVLIFVLICAKVHCTTATGIKTVAAKECIVTYYYTNLFIYLFI
jgi:hypothetical protein